MNKLKLILNRLREPSTWAGIAALAFSVGWCTQAEALVVTESIPPVLAGLAALLSVFLPEGK